MKITNPFKRRKEEEPSKSEEEIRSEEGRESLRKAREERKAKEEAQLKIQKDAESYFEGVAKETGLSPLEVVNKVFENDVMLIEFDETVGKASLVYKSWESTLPALGETQELSEAVIMEFRNLRKNFAPVAAGVEWHRDFTSGGGFTVQVDDPKDTHKKKMQDEIKAFCANIYQDQYTMGLDKILDIMMDTTLTDGCAAAEIVYDVEVDFMDYVEGFEEVIVKDKNGKKITVQIMIPKEPDWNGTLKRITRLKIIDDAYNRLRPYRHPISGEVLFWTLEEKADIAQWATRETINKDCIKFHPWEIFWLSWNQTGTNLKGMSIIQPVYGVAKFVKAIQNAVGVGFNRWANKKYFFVCGTEKRPWSKPAQTAFLKGMAQMIKYNYVGIPVPAGFTIENIGGEGTVFEGKSLLDYLTGQICTGMQFPRDFLETGKTQASDKSWLAWTVRYGRNQQQARRAIEQQLWKRYLWCLHGKDYRIPKKGVPVGDQEHRLIYIPKLQWRAEGRWHREKKVELFKSLLDAANPIDPPLKMAVQKGIADVLGFGEIDWSTIIELFEVRSETNLLTAKLEKLIAEAKFKEADELGVEGLLKQLQEREKAKLAQAQPEKPVEVPTEQELERRAQARLEGGVSRTHKGEARPMGGTREPKRVAETVEEPDELRKAMLETQRLEQERIKMEITKSKAEFERQQKKIEILDELEERMKKKKKTIRKEETEPLPFVTTGHTPMNKNEKPKPQKPQKIKLDINVKSEPVKAEVDVNVQTPKEVEETKEREKAELELIGEQKKLVEKQNEMLDEEKLEKENEKETKRKLRERKKKVLDKIEKKVDENE